MYDTRRYLPPLASWWHDFRAIDMLTYLLVCIASLLAGFGLLKILRAPLPPALAWLIAPGIAPFSVGGVYWCRHLTRVDDATIDAICLGCDSTACTHRLAIDSPAASASRAGSRRMGDAAPGPDAGRRHVAWPAELCRYPGGDGCRMSPMDMVPLGGSEGIGGPLPAAAAYASHLSSTRFMSGALLGAFSPLFAGGGDTQAAVGGLIAWALLVWRVGRCARGDARPRRPLALCGGRARRAITVGIRCHQGSQLRQPPRAGVSPLAAAFVGALISLTRLGGVLAGASRRRRSTHMPKWRSGRSWPADCCSSAGRPVTVLSGRGHGSSGLLGPLCWWYWSHRILVI